MSPLNRLLNETTGEIDQLSVAEAIKVDAAREWGGPDYPPRYLRKSEQYVRDRAEAMRRNWHRDRGLPVPGEEVLVTGFVPSWGASGDSFRR